jgi:hypothetical protein
MAARNDSETWHGRITDAIYWDKWNSMIRLEEKWEVGSLAAFQGQSLQITGNVITRAQLEH